MTIEHIETTWVVLVRSKGGGEPKPWRIYRYCDTQETFESRQSAREEARLLRHRMGMETRVRRAEIQVLAP